MQQVNQPIGTFACAFKTGIGDTGVSTLWGQGTDFREARMEFKLDANGFFQVYLRQNSFGDNSATWTGNVDLRDGAWHLVIIRQKNDGTGMEIFIDSNVAGTLTKVDGSGFSDDADAWFQYVATTSNGNERQYCSDNGFTGADHLLGNLAIIGLRQAAMSDADITILMAGGEWAVADFSNKTIRRKNRRIYFDI